MKKINIQTVPYYIGALAIFVMAIYLVKNSFLSDSGNTSEGEYSDRISAKVEQMAKDRQVDIETIRSDKRLMEQITLESDYEERLETISDSITVTEDEMSSYRNMIGDSMDVKRSHFIIFNTHEECSEFIAQFEETGNLATNTGVSPLMESDEAGEYFNVVGNPELESAFNNLKDGDYLREPLEYAGMYCFFKRIGVSSPIDDNKKLIDFIKNEKAQKQLSENDF